MALEGPLKELHLQDVFQLLELGRKSGVLRVSSELRQTSAFVCFDRGAVVAAALGGQPRPLEARATRDMQREMRAQIEETICGLLSWREGYFWFEEAGLAQTAAESPVRLPTEALLMEAARRLDEWSRIEAKVPHLGVVPKLPPPEQEADGRLDLIPFEWEILAAVDGERDLRELADALGRSAFDVARTVYRLTTVGVLALDDPTRAAASVEPDPLLLEARRLVEVCQQALLSPADDTLAPAVHRLRAAAAILTKEAGVAT